MCDVPSRGTVSQGRVVPLTHEHMVEWYGEVGTIPTIKGIAGFVGEELVAVAGLHYNKGNVVAFCSLSEGAKPFKKLIHKTA